jgi:hypothetical protein
MAQDRIKRTIKSIGMALLAVLRLLYCSFEIGSKWENPVSVSELPTFAVEARVGNSKTGHCPTSDSALIEKIRTSAPQQSGEFLDRHTS